LQGIRDLYWKWKRVREQLTLASSGDVGTIFVNYLSATGAGAWKSYLNGSFSVPPFFVASGKDLPDEASAQLRTEYFTNNSDRYPDFPRDDCVGDTCWVLYAGTNQLTSKHLGAGGYGRVGIVMADFPGRSLIENVIAQNFRQAGGTP
jgi:1-phosphatidylinositol phosphodiesterase